MGQPDRQCDIVLRGGIASGIVYPTAIFELAREYRFRSIGGTSAGAIAAAAAAAAEFGRRENTNSNSFSDLAAVPKELAQRAGGRSKLLRLFQPQQKTAWLHRMTMSILNNSGQPLFALFVICMRALLRANPVVGFVGALPAVLAAYLILFKAPALQFDLATPLPELAVFGVTLGMGLLIVAALLVLKRLMALFVIAMGITIGIAIYYLPDIWQSNKVYERVVENSLPFGLAAFLLAVALGSAVLLASYRTIQRARYVLPENMFGICAGVPSPAGGGSDKPQEQHLTDWLHGTFQRLAGKPTNEPLTIGELRHSDNPEDTSVDLALMTTDLARGMSHCFPQLEGASNWRGKLYFYPNQLAKLLPPEVIKHLKDKSQTPEGEHGFVDADGKPDERIFYRLPKPDDLPVLLGVRMSMSFPLLLSAVPLYTPTPYSGVKPASAEGAQRMRCCWFSDGGLTSNFPIHFFDSPIPRRPTFGISLADNDTEILAGKRGSTTAVQSIWMVSVRSKEQFLRFSDFDSNRYSLTSFISALFATSRNWSDTEQMNMPGYRERIVHVLLDENEGGLNLDMPVKIIEGMAAKGTQAGQKLRDQFADEEAWNDHRWIRYRAFMASLEVVARKFQDRWSNPPSSSTARALGGLPFPTLVRVGEKRDDPFPWGEGQFEPSFEVTEAFVELACLMKNSGIQLFDRDGDGQEIKGGSPRPKPRLKIVPPDDSELPKQG